MRRCGLGRMLNRMLRAVVASLFFLVALGLLGLSYGALRWLWAENPDSPDWVYIANALVAWGLAAIAVGLGTWILRKR